MFEAGMACMIGKQTGEDGEDKKEAGHSSPPPLLPNSLLSSSFPDFPLPLLLSLL